MFDDLPFSKNEVSSVQQDEERLPTPQDSAIESFFRNYIRPHQEGVLFVKGQEKDYLLDVTTVYAHPKIPQEVMVNAKFRYQIEPGPDGILLLSVNENQGVQLFGRNMVTESIVLTTQLCCWWDTEQRQPKILSLRDIRSAYPVISPESRGVKLTDQTTRLQHFIALPLHDALLSAIAHILDDAHMVINQALIDLNNAPLELLLTLPGLNAYKAKQLVMERQSRHGFKGLDEVADFLMLSSTERQGLHRMAIVHPVQKKRPFGRRVDY